MTQKRGMRPVRVLAALSLAFIGCLPRGDVPSGRQLVADRGAFLLSLVPSNGDGLVRALVFRPGKDDTHVDLWVAAADPNGGPTTELKLFPDFDSEVEVSYKPDANGYGLPADSRGRLLLSKERVDGQPQYGYDLFRIDPVSGEMLDLGPGSYASPSPSGHRLLISSYSLSGPASSHTLFDETDGSTTPLEGTHPTFVGEAVLYVTAAGELTRLPAAGAPERLATGVYDFQLATNSYQVTNDHLLLLTRAVPDPNMTDPSQPSQPSQPAQPPPVGFPPTAVTASLLDTSTLVETPLPDGFLYQEGEQFSWDARSLTVRART